MLVKVIAKNIALIEYVEINFTNGLNVITGETGSGKSIVLNAITWAFGGKLSKDSIRTGEKEAYVEVALYIEDEKVKRELMSIGIGFDDDNTLIISRELSDTGKSITKVNFKMVPQSLLKEIGEVLIDIHGQHDSLSLLREEQHIGLIDEYAGSSLAILKEEYSEKLAEYLLVKEKYESLINANKDNEQRLDYIKFQRDEIVLANVKEGEEEELRERRKFLMNAEKIFETVNSVYDNLSFVDILDNVRSELSGIREYDEELDEMYSRFEEMYYELSDMSEVVRKYKENVYVDEKEINDIEERLDVINGLKRKYGNTFEELKLYLRKINTEIEELENFETNETGLKEKLLALKNEVRAIADKMHSVRKKYSVDVEEKLLLQFCDLDMKDARLVVKIECDEDWFGKNGSDKIVFNISTNKGEPERALSKIVSGGEMSRIMLAFKTVFAEVDSPPILVFDEIDAGIGGVTAQKIADKLLSVSKSKQVICVTHLSQIASIANNHILVEKVEDDKRTKTITTMLDKEGRVMELSRILVGNNITDTTIRQAEELLD